MPGWRYLRVIIASVHIATCNAHTTTNVTQNITTTKTKDYE